MYWQESGENPASDITTDVTDLTFNMICQSLPVDHIYSLSNEIMKIISWLNEEGQAGIHSIHVAESGNGWMRPEKPDDLIFPSKRTKLVLRIPLRRVKDANELCGKELEIDGHSLNVGTATVRPLSTINVLFARYVVIDNNKNEEEFLAEIVDQLQEIDIQPKKMLCGIKKQIKTPQADIHTRSLMLADLSTEDSIKLQEAGLGPNRHLGCGLFIPHKGVNQLSGSGGIN